MDVLDARDLERRDKEHQHFASMQGRREERPNNAVHFGTALAKSHLLRRMGLPSLLRQPQGDWREMVQNSGSCKTYKTEVASHVAA